MAKGVEDTAFYRYLRLLALNDVGGDPGRFGISIEQFHAANAERAERFPHNLLVTQTHDTKRSGDVRARIGALSAMPDDGRRTCADGSSCTRGYRPRPPRTTSSATSSSRRSPAPGRSSASGWRPTWRRRCARPSARRTGSSPTRRTRPAVQAFCAALYEHEAFLADFEPFAAELAQRRRPRRARAAAAQAHRAGPARRLPGRRAAVALAGRPRQPPPGRLGAAAAAARRDSPRRCPDGRVAQAVADRARARSAPRPAATRSPAATSRSTPARRRSRSCAAATSSRPPRSAATPPRSPLPPGRWRDALWGGRARRRHPPSSSATGSPCSSAREGALLHPTANRGQTPRRGSMKRWAHGVLERVLLTTWRALAESVEDRIHRDAAQVGFFAMLSFVPLALLLVAAFGLAFDDDERPHAGRQDRVREHPALARSGTAPSWSRRSRTRCAMRAASGPSRSCC